MMYLLVLSVCVRVLLAGSSETDDDSVKKIDIFERYAGNLIYTDDTDGSCIACNRSCDEGYACNRSCDAAHAVSPHSWTAKLEYMQDDEVKYNDFLACEGYAKQTAEFGVVAFTWNSRNHSCSLHVLDETHNIAEEMINFNGFDWIEENENNIGPLFQVRYPKGIDEGVVDAMCYYGLNINQTPNVAKEMNQVLIFTVVIIVIAWNGWMNHTKNFPHEHHRGHGDHEELDVSDNGHSIYTSSTKKDE